MINKHSAAGDWQTLVCVCVCVPKYNTCFSLWGLPCHPQTRHSCKHCGTGKHNRFNVQVYLYLYTRSHMSGQGGRQDPCLATSGATTSCKSLIQTEFPMVCILFKDWVLWGNISAGEKNRTLHLRMTKLQKGLDMTSHTVSVLSALINNRFSAAPLSVATKFLSTLHPSTPIFQPLPVGALEHTHKQGTHTNTNRYAHRGGQWESYWV